MRNLAGGEGIVVVDSLGNFYVKSIENDTIVLKNIQITDALSIGMRTLHLTATTGSGAGENTIHTTNGLLDIQGEGNDECNNTIINKLCGNVGIGCPKPQSKLLVNGKIEADEIEIIDITGCDFVFEVDYDLLKLAKLEEYIKANKHLPGIAPATEMVTNNNALLKLANTY